MTATTCLPQPGHQAHHRSVFQSSGRPSCWRRLFLSFAIATTVLAADDAEQPWLVRVWKVSEGLSGTNVAGVAQTADGFIWVVAGGELARFDGATFVPYPSDKYMAGPTRKIREFIGTSEGGLALATYDGRIVRLNGGEPYILPVVVPHERRLEALTEDDDGNFLIVYNDESVWRVHDKSLTMLTDDDGLPSGAHCRFTRDRQGRIWFAKGDYVGVMEGPKFRTLQRFSENSYVRVAAASDGGVWIGAGAKLFHYEIGQSPVEVATVPVKDIAVRPTYLLEDREGAVWFGTYSSGLFHFYGNRFESVPISHRQAVTMMEDREGNMWVATSGGGLDEVQPRAITIEGGETGVPYQAVQCIVEDSKHHLWAFTQNGVVVSRQSGGWKKVDEIKPDGEVSCMAVDQANALWFGTKTGALHCWRAGQLSTWKHREGDIDSVGTARLQSLLATRSGDIWLAGARPATLQRLRAGHFQTFELPRPADAVRCLAEDANGNIWVAVTGRQLACISPAGKLEDRSGVIASLDRNVRILQPHPDGSLWMSLDQIGIARLKNGELRRVTAHEGLLTNRIEAMLPDARGGWWFAGGETIFSVSEKALVDVLEGRAKHLEPVRYGREQGVRPVFGESVGPLRRTNGKLWIPMATSLAIIDPAQVRPLSEPPPVWITDLRVDDQLVAEHHSVLSLEQVPDAENAPIHLRPEHRRIALQFTAPSFRIPSNVAFRYRLDPFDDHWSDAAPQRMASYSRLVAGTYRFRVIACNGDGVWNETGAVATMIVAPFFWETWWFRAAFVAVLALAVLGLARYVANRRLRLRLHAAEQETAVERERARIARDIHDDLGSRLTRILMLSGLVKRDQAAPEKAEQRIDEIADTARQVLKSLDETVWAVDPRNDNLPEIISYLAQFAESFLRTAEITCELDLPADPSPEHVSTPAFRHELFLTVKEALTNIVRHAQATRVTFGVRVTADTIELSIADDGRGFSGSSTDAHADGLRNMRQRMEQIGGRFEIESSPPSGTRITLVAPWPPRA